MIYAYINDWEKDGLPQAEKEKKRADILKYAKNFNWTISKWYNEGRVEAVLAQMKPGDILLTPEISSLGVSLRDINKLIKSCVDYSLKIIVVRDDYIFDDGLNTRLLALAMETVIKIIADIKSQNMQKSLQRLRCQGKNWGRPKGSINKSLKLNGYEDIIRKLLAQNVSKSEISRKLGVNRMTLHSFLEKMDE